MENKLYPIPGFPRYFITKDARVWSSRSNKFLSPNLTNKNRYIIRLQESLEGGVYAQKGIQLSRLMAVTFLGMDINSDLEVDHINCDSLDNRLSNLQVLSKDAHFLKTMKDQDKNLVIGVHLCERCNKQLTKHNKSGKCTECKHPNKNMDPALIKEEVLNTSWSAASRKFGVSDNGLRKMYSRLSGEDWRLVK